MMVALLLYAYARGIRSSRVIERACVEDVAFRVVAAQQRPDHATIARFIERHEAALAGLFGEVLLLCARSGLAKVGVIAIDGTKVQANASRDANVDYEQLAREIIEEAKAIDAAEDELYGDRARRRAARGAVERAGPARVAARSQAAPGGRARPLAAAGAALAAQARQGGQAALGRGAVDRVPGQRGLRALPHRTHERRAALQSRARSLHAAEHAAGAHQHHRSGLARGQGAARVHPGLQRAGRHQRAPDRPRRRGDDRRR